jgi:hypothetical protein
MGAKNVAKGGESTWHQRVRLPLIGQVNAAAMQPLADGYRSRVEGVHRNLERFHYAGIELYAASAAQLLMNDRPIDFQAAVA